MSAYGAKLVAVLAGVLTAACSSNGSGSSAGGASGDGAAALDGGVSGPTDAAPRSVIDAAPTPDDSAASVAFLRVAHLSTELPAADFCVADSSGGAFRGPLLAQLAAALSASGDGGTAGVSYAQVSTYFTVDAGPIGLRLVAPGAASCDRPLAIGSDGDAGDDAGAALEVGALPALAGGAYVTLLVLGAQALSVDAGLRWVEIGDDGRLTSGGAALRAVNAIAGSVPQDFGLGSVDGGWVPLVSNVPFGAAGANAAPLQGAVDPNGYLAVAPFDHQTLSARASSGAIADTVTGTGGSVPFGSLASVFAVGAAGDASAGLVLCLDNGTPVGVLSNCTFLP